MARKRTVSITDPKAVRQVADALRPKKVDVAHLVGQLNQSAKDAASSYPSLEAMLSAAADTIDRLWLKVRQLETVVENQEQLIDELTADRGSCG